LTKNKIIFRLLTLSFSSKFYRYLSSLKHSIAHNVPALQRVWD
jgi:hypothetical protein